jgi:hypothetical protein
MNNVLINITYRGQSGNYYAAIDSGTGAIPKFDMAERPSLLRLEYEHPNERRKDS